MDPSSAERVLATALRYTAAALGDRYPAAGSRRARRCPPRLLCRATLGELRKGASQRPKVRPHCPQLTWEAVAVREPLVWV